MITTGLVDAIKYQNKAKENIKCATRVMALNLASKSRSEREVAFVDEHYGDFHLHVMNSMSHHKFCKIMGYK